MRSKHQHAGKLTVHHSGHHPPNYQHLGVPQAFPMKPRSSSGFSLPLVAVDTAKASTRWMGVGDCAPKVGKKLSQVGPELSKKGLDPGGPDSQPRPFPIRSFICLMLVLQLGCWGKGRTPLL